MIWTISKERLDKLFDCVANEVASSGGDGCGTIMFRKANIQEVAKAFEIWRAAQPFPNWLPFRIDYSRDHILFTDKSNENITFVSEEVVNTWPEHMRGIGHNEIWLEVW